MKVRVFVVEDELWVRRGLLFRLRSLDDTIEVAGDADSFSSALSGVRAVGHIDALLTDIVLPDGNGLDLVGEVKRVFPDIRVYIISGYSKFEYAHRAIELGVSGYILKPLALDALDNMARELRQSVLGNIPLDVDGAAVAEVTRCESKCDAAEKIRALLAPYADMYPSRAGLARVCEAFARALDVHSPELASRLSAAVSYFPDYAGWSAFAADAMADAVMRAGATNSVQRDKLIAGVKEYINIYYRENISLETLSIRFGVSPAYLSRIFKGAGSEGFSEYLARVRIGAACQLLTSGGKSINEIAEELNFPDASYFSKTFKRCTGRTPSQYRRGL